MREKKGFCISGYLALLLAVVAGAGGTWLIIAELMEDVSSVTMIGVGAFLLLLALVALSSLVIVQPNEAKVVTFFGTYVGTVVESGLWMVMPLSNKSTVSLKVRN